MYDTHAQMCKSAHVQINFTKESGGGKMNFIVYIKHHLFFEFIPFCVFYSISLCDCYCKSVAT